MGPYLPLWPPLLVTGVFSDQVVTMLLKWVPGG